MRRSMSVFAAAGLALLIPSACNSQQSKGCARIQIDLVASGMFHVGVLGSPAISGSPCFKLVNTKTRKEVGFKTDPVTTDWDEVSTYTKLPVTESLVANTPQGSYEMSVPVSWTQTDQKQLITFGTPDMKGSLGVTPRDFSIGSPTMTVIMR